MSKPKQKEGKQESLGRMGAKVSCDGRDRERETERERRANGDSGDDAVSVLAVPLPKQI